MTVQTTTRLVKESQKAGTEAETIHESKKNQNGSGSLGKKGEKRGGNRLKCGEKKGTFPDKCETGKRPRKLEKKPKKEKESGNGLTKREGKQRTSKKGAIFHLGPFI